MRAPAVAKESMSYTCPYCPEDYSAPSEELLMTHIRIVHSNDLDFSIQCSLNGCERTFANFRTYQNHRLTHRSVVCTESPADNSEESSSLDAPSLPQFSSSEMTLFAAKWILKTRETRSLTRSAMQGVIEDVSNLVCFVTQSLKAQAHAVLQSQGVEPDSISSLDDVFTAPATTPFEGLSSFHQQLQYCHSMLNLIVSY